MKLIISKSDLEQLVGVNPEKRFFQKISEIFPKNFKTSSEEEIICKMGEVYNLCLAYQLGSLINNCSTRLAGDMLNECGDLISLDEQLIKKNIFQRKKTNKAILKKYDLTWEFCASKMGSESIDNFSESVCIDKLKTYLSYLFPK